MPSALRAPLHNAEVRGAGVAAGDSLNGNAVADGLDGAYEGDDHEGGGGGAQNSTPGGDVDARPGGQGGRLSIARRESAERRIVRRGAATAVPMAMPMTGDHSLHAGGARRTRTATTTRVTRAAMGAPACGSAFGRFVEGVENDGHDGGGDEHDDGAGHHGGEDAAEEGEAGGEQELNEGGHEDEAGHGGRAGLQERRHAHGDEGA